MTEEIPLNVKIKQEKLSPEPKDSKDDIEKLLDSKLFGENDEKKDLEPIK
jgi:hypothetical protein